MPIARGGAAHPRAPPGPAVRPPRHLRPVPVLPGLPAPRPLHHRGPRADRAHPQATQLGGDSLEYTARVSESLLARLHFVVRPPRRASCWSATSTRPTSSAGSPRPPGRGATTSPPPCTRSTARSAAPRLARRYADSFPEAYKEDYPPRTGAVDLGRLESVEGDEGMSLSFYQPMDAGPREARLKVFRIGRPLSLSHVLPVLSSMGVEVVDERPYELDDLPRPSHIYDFGLRYAHDMPGRRPRALPGRRRRGLGGPQRGRRLQRPGAGGRPDLAAGHRAARLREVHAPGRHAVRPGLHRGRAQAERRHHPLPRRAVRDPLRPGPQRRHRPGRRGPHREDRGPRGAHQPGARRRGQPRPRPDPAVLPDRHPGDPAHQLLPGRRRRAAEALHRLQARAPTRSRTCPSRGRSSRSSSTRRGSRACTCASARSPAVACAGRTAATTSAPRCSAWSRRRWSRTP